MTYLSRWVVGESYGRWMIEAEASASYHAYCAQIYDLPICQFNQVDRDQMETLVGRIFTGKPGHVLDLGCGLGTVTEYLAERTGVHLTGVDLAARAVSRASERTRAKAERLRFEVGDMDALGLPEASFDRAILLDSLYLAEDLGRTLRGLIPVLRRPGELGIFCSDLARNRMAADRLTPATTRLGRVLGELGVDFEAVDFTALEHRLWRRQKVALRELEGAFHEEGRDELYEVLRREARTGLEWARGGRIRRYFYHVRPFGGG